MYPDAEFKAKTSPITKAMPAPPPLEARPSIAPVRISFAGPGATLPMFSSSGSVAAGPTRPMIETSAMSAGNSASTA